MDLTGADKLAGLALEMPESNCSGLGHLGFGRAGRNQIMVKPKSILVRFLDFFSSVKCGLILLGLLGTVVVLGTMILQRPLASEGQIEQIYAPQTIRLLNFFGLFDVFHSWWFILLLGTLGANITLASVERLPQAWRYFSRPRLTADEWFVRNLPLRREIPIGPQATGEALEIAARKVESLGFRPRRESLEQGTLYIERHRVARLAPYVVHLSLLIIFAGAIVDGLWGYRGFVNLGPGMRTDSIEPLSGSGPARKLSFTLRCDRAGMEKYPDGSPKQYWTWLAVEENGREVLRKQIFVNEPLTYEGVRFFQANYGPSGAPAKLVMEASWPGQARAPVEFTLRPDAPARLDEQGTEVELGDFVPDFILEENQISTRSNEPNNPALRLVVTRPGAKKSSVWVFPNVPKMNFPDESGIAFRLRDFQMGYTTGLQVAKQPGKGLIWGGCLLLTAGLMMALYLAHTRIWGVVGHDRKGRGVLVLGGQPSKYRANFEAQFESLAESLVEEFRAAADSARELERLTA